MINKFEKWAMNGNTGDALELIEEYQEVDNATDEREINIFSFECNCGSWGNLRIENIVRCRETSRIEVIRITFLNHDEIIEYDDTCDKYLLLYHRARVLYVHNSNAKELSEIIAGDIFNIIFDEG